MSGYQRPKTQGTPPLRLPRVTGDTPGASQINAAMQQLENADGQNLKRGQETQHASLILTDTNKISWRVTVSTTGALAVTRIARGPTT